MTRCGREWQSNWNNHHFLRIISDQQIQQTLTMMGQPSDARLTPEIARDLCQRSGSKAYLSGSIASLGSQYVLGLKTVNCFTGETLAEEQERASGKKQDADPDIPILQQAKAQYAKLRQVRAPAVGVEVLIRYS